MLSDPNGSKRSWTRRLEVVGVWVVDPPVVALLSFSEVCEPLSAVCDNGCQRAVVDWIYFTLGSRTQSRLHGVEVFAERTITTLVIVATLSRECQQLCLCTVSKHCSDTFFSFFNGLGLWVSNCWGVYIVYISPVVWGNDAYSMVCLLTGCRLLVVCSLKLLVTPAALSILTRILFFLSSSFFV